MTEVIGQHAQFDHFLLTRFNVMSRPEQMPPSDQWLRNRLDLFRSYCVHSVMAQTHTAFTWLVFVDADTPTWFVEELNLARKAAGDVFEIVEVSGVFDGDSAARAIGALSLAPFVITTRVDNDDAVARDFIERIQLEFHGQDFQFVNFIDGAQIAGNAVYLRPYNSNPFISLIERRQVGGALSTVYLDEHGLLSRHGRIKDVRTGHIMWLQVVHAANLANEIIGLRVRGRSALSHFDLPPVSEPPVIHFWVDVVRTGFAIVWRMVRKPTRLVALAKATVVRRG